MEALLDKVLTVIFSPLSIVGIKKCSKCTVRVRLAQLGLFVTTPIAFVNAEKLARARVRWDLTVHPEKKTLTRVRLPYIRPFEAAKREEGKP